jgi:hypothetical protein
MRYYSCEHGRMTEYFAKLTSAKDRVVKELQRRGVEPRYLQFGGPGDVLA